MNSFSTQGNMRKNLYGIENAITAKFSWEKKSKDKKLSLNYLQLMNFGGDREKQQFLALSKATPELSHIFKENNRTYQVRIQVAKYTKYSEKLTNDSPIIYAGLDKSNNHTILIFGAMIPNKESQKQEFEQCILLIISILDQKLELKKWKVLQYRLFQYEPDDSLQIERFPDSDDLATTEIYVLHSNFLVRSGMIFSGSEIMSFVKKRIEFVDSLFQLSKLKVFKYEMISSIKEYVKQQDTSYKDIQFIRRQSLIKKSTGVFNNKSVDDFDEEEINNFNKDSKILGQPLDSYEKNYQGMDQIPLILDILIQYFTSNEQQMLEEGIFRKQAAVLEEKILEAALANKKYQFIGRIEDPHVVCGIIKQFFLALPEPVIPFNVYDRILEHSSGKVTGETALQYVLMVLGALPKQNIQIVAFMCQFLWKVISFSEKNKMTAYNMAVVFGPSFFRAKRQSMNDFTYIGQNQILVQQSQQCVEEKKTDSYQKPAQQQQQSQLQQEQKHSNPNQPQSQNHQQKDGDSSPRSSIGSNDQNNYTDSD